MIEVTKKSEKVFISLTEIKIENTAVTTLKNVGIGKSLFLKATNEGICNRNDIITEIIIEKQEKEFGKSETPHKSERESNTENCNAFILLFKFIINSHHIL